MVFSLAINARAIEECQPLGEAGMSIVAAFMNSLNQNCLLIVCPDSTFSLDSLVKAMNAEWLDFSTREKFNATLPILRSSNRIISYRVKKCETEEYGNPTTTLAHSLANVVDQVIVTGDCKLVGKSVTLPRFALSPFEGKRSQTCSKGISKALNACDVQELLSTAFRSLLSWSDQVDLIDYSLGSHWLGNDGYPNKNYTDSIPHWCLFFRSLEQKMRIVIRTSYPKSLRYDKRGCRDLEADIKQNFTKLLVGSGVDVRVEIGPQVHSRFLHCCSFLIDIDRGIDICLENGKVRQTSFGFKNDEKLLNQLKR